MSNHRKSDGPKSPEVSLQDRIRQLERHVVEEIQVKDTHSGIKQKKRAWFAEVKFIAAWSGMWLLVTVAALIARGAWPPDETRLLSVAWEMWSQHHYFAPSLNGDADLHPPFFFWLVHLGWLAFGVSEWWARFVGPLGALASLIMLQRVARLLWPAEADVVRYAPLFLLGMFGFVLATGATAPDTWTLCFVLMSFWGLLIRWRRNDMRAWLLVGAGLGLGVLSGGVLVLVYVLPLALFAPLWARAPKPQWKFWYIDLLKACGVMLALTAIWLSASATRYGAPFLARLLTHAADGTPLAMFARQQPWWWYAALVPFVLLPWFVMPLAWMRLWSIRREPLEDGFVFCLLWVVLPVLLLSVLPVKQPQFLLPLLPAGALFAARLLFGEGLRGEYEENPLAGMAVPLVILGGVQMALPRLPRVDFLPTLLWEQSAFVGVAIMGVGIASAWLPLKDVRARVLDIACVCALLVVFVVLGVASQFDKLYPMAEVGQALAQAQSRGQPIAFVGDYNGDFQFAGRLQTPLASVSPALATSWALEHPNGALLAPADRWQPRVSAGTTPLLDVQFRDTRLRLYGANQLPVVSGLTN